MSGLGFILAASSAVFNGSFAAFSKVCVIAVCDTDKGNRFGFKHFRSFLSFLSFLSLLFPMLNHSKCQAYTGTIQTPNLWPGFSRRLQSAYYEQHMRSLVHLYGSASLFPICWQKDFYCFFFLVFSLFPFHLSSPPQHNSFQAFNVQGPNLSSSTFTSAWVSLFLDFLRSRSTRYRRMKSE